MDQRPSDFRPSVEPEAENTRKMGAIRSDMEETRASLADKLESLQERVVGTVETAQATVEQAAEKMQETVQAAWRVLDVRYQTEQRPWMMFGLSVLAGAAVGFLTGGKSRPAAPERAEHRPRRHHPTAGNGRSPEQRTVSSAPSEPSMFGEEWQKLKGMAVGATMALARDWLKEAAPGLARQIDQLVDNATRKLGGEPVEGSPFQTAGPESRFGGLGHG